MKPSLAYLSQSELETIHSTALQILEELGMRLPNAEALAALRAAGAQVEGKEVVRLPRNLIGKAIDLAPKRHAVTLHARRPRYDVRFAAHHPALAAMTMATHVLDPLSGERRPATSDDLASLTRITHALEHIAVNGGLVTPQEVPGEINDWVTWAVTIKNTSKHITGGMHGARCVRDAVAMGALAAGGEENFRNRPFISGWVLTLPPLSIDSHSLEALVEMSRFKIPAIVSSGPILGTSSPVTLAGTLAQAHAEILACLAVSQVINPGAPFVYTSFARGMDMRTGNVSMACPEFAVLKAAMAQLGRFLDLPVRMPGLLRDAKLLDAQAGFETGMVGALAAMGADLLDGMQLDADLLVDFADPVFCNDCMGALKRLARPLEVTPQSLALHVLREVGHGGSFLTHDHTFEHFRRELWEPALMERRSYETWQAAGARDARSRALRKALQILEQPFEDALDPQTEARIDAILGTSPEVFS